MKNNILNLIFQCKTVSVSPEMSAHCVVRQALQVLQNGSTEPDADGDADDHETDNRWGAVNEFTLCVRTSRDAPPTPLRGIERPHAVQVHTTLILLYTTLLTQISGKINVGNAGNPNNFFLFNSNFISIADVKNKANAI